MDYKDITENDVYNWIKKNGMAEANIAHVVLTLLASGDMPLDEFRQEVMKLKLSKSDS